ncbi:MAG: hypothetical protein BWZ04_00661 [Firmicutes bacterium ADurb.BinA205]|nr:MAG: hypothetical protein BWZ04_00661 [Firmicutes bacterium ADurb.BinA205]
MSIRNYDEDVEYNLNNCFDESGKFVNSEDYKDPDYSTYHSIVVVPKILISKNGEENTEIKVGMTSDGLISAKKLEKYTLDGVSEKDLYILFRMEMKNCLVWPSRTWSINQARRSLGNDDRLDMLLCDIAEFYSISKDYDNITAEFISKVYEKLPNTAGAFLNMPTLVWLSGFRDFNDFIIKRELEAFVNEDKEEKNYLAVKWDEYYEELLKRTVAYKKNHDLPIPESIRRKYDDSKK